LQRVECAQIEATDSSGRRLPRCHFHNGDRRVTHCIRRSATVWPFGALGLLLADVRVASPALP